MAALHPDADKLDYILDVRRELREHEHLFVVRLVTGAARSGVVPPVYASTIKRDFYLATQLNKIMAFFQEYLRGDSEGVRFPYLTIGGRVVPLGASYGSILTVHSPTGSTAPLTFLVHFDTTPPEYTFLQNIGSVEELKLPKILERLQQDPMTLRITLLREARQVSPVDESLAVVAIPSPDCSDYAKVVETAAKSIQEKAITDYKRTHFEELMNENLSEFLRETFFHAWKESFYLKTDLPSYIRQQFPQTEFTRFFDTLQNQRSNVLADMVDKVFATAVKAATGSFSPFKILVKVYVTNLGAWVARKSTDDITLGTFVASNFGGAVERGMVAEVTAGGVLLPLHSRMIDVAAIFSGIDYVLHLKIHFIQS
jgi:hypothetical protein